MRTMIGHTALLRLLGLAACVGTAAAFLHPPWARKRQWLLRVAAGSAVTAASPAPPCTLASLMDGRGFFARPDATALVFTDVKIDDALFLWMFFKLNLERPPTHRVSLVVVVIGVRDRISAVALVRDLLESATRVHRERERERDSRSFAHVSLRVLASRRRPPVAPRHELDTYAPYAALAPGFAPCVMEDDDRDLDFFQDDAALVAGGCADLVAVMAQFFACELYDAHNDDGAAPRRGGGLDALRVLTPRAGGALAIQAGFNTRVARGDPAAERAVWGALAERVGGGGAHVVLVSNVFSFAADADGGGARTRPCTMAPSDPLGAALRAAAPRRVERCGGSACAAVTRSGSEAQSLHASCHLYQAMGAPLRRRAA